MHDMAWLTVGGKGVTEVVRCVFQRSLAGDPGLDCEAEEAEHCQAAVAHLRSATTGCSTGVTYRRFVNSDVGTALSLGHAYQQLAMNEGLAEPQAATDV